MSRTVTETLGVWVQAVVGVVFGAMFWTGVLVRTPEIGHWLVNALVLAPSLALAFAGFIHAKVRRLAVFGWSFVGGTAVYGYLFTFLVLVHF
ncbi:hypothetical protein ACWF9G_04300 [Nocardia sp. NPDC055029]